MARAGAAAAFVDGEHAPSVSEVKRVDTKTTGGQNLAAKSDDGVKGGGKKSTAGSYDTMSPAFGHASGKVNPAGKSDDGDKGGDKGGGKKGTAGMNDTMGPASGDAQSLAAKSDDVEKGGDKGGSKKMPPLNTLVNSSPAQDPSRGASPSDVQNLQRTNGEVAH